MKTTSKTVFLIFLCFLWLNLNAGTRIAIVSDNSQKLSDLLTAELSKVDGVELLDRTEIRKVLKEHKISAQMLDSKQTLKLNKLLKTDLFIVIESEKKSMKPIGLIVFDANTGVRYWDSALPDGNIEKIANFASDAVKKALGKREKAIGGKIKYISLLGVRNADLPREQDPYCQSVGILLMRQLGNSEDIVVLERTYLDWLNKERKLPRMDWVNELLASNLLLELELSKAEGNRVKADLLLPNKKKITANGLLNEIAKFANDLASQVTDYLEINKVEFKPDKRAEIRRFFNEYLIFQKHVMRDKSAEKIAVAYALEPNRRDISLAHMKSLAFLADENIQSPKTVDKGLEIMEDAINLSTKLSQNPTDQELNFESSVKFTVFNNRIDLRLGNLLPIYNYGKNRSISRNMTDSQISRIKELHSKWMALRKQAFSNHYIFGSRSFIDNKQSFQRYTDFIDRYTDLEAILTAEQWLSDCLPKIDKWIENAAKYTTKTGEEPPSVSPLLNMSRLTTHHPEFTNEYQKPLKKLIDKLKKHPSHYLRAYGLMFELNLKLNEEFVKEKLRYLSIYGTECSKLRKKIFEDIYPPYLKQCMLVRTNLPEKIPEKVRKLYDHIIVSPLPFPECKKEMPKQAIDNLTQSEKTVSSDLPWQKTIVSLDFRGKRKLEWESSSLLSYAISKCKSFCYVTVVGNKHTKDSRFKENAIYLLKISFNTGVAEIISKYEFGKSESVKQPDRDYCGEGVIYKDIFISPSLNGIMMFPVAGKKPIRIGKDSGLFAENVNSLCVRDNKIYALADDHSRGLLIECDMANKYKVRTLDSSLKSKPDRGPVLPSRMALCEIYSSEQKNHLIAKINGKLLKYDLKTGKWSNLISNLKIQFSKKLDENNLLLAGFDFTCVYNIKDDSIVYIMGKKNKNPRLEFIYSKTIHGWPQAVGNKYFWSGNKFMCRSFKKGKIQKLKHPKWTPESNSYCVNLLEMVDDKKKLFLGTSDGLFLLTLQDGDEKD